VTGNRAARSRSQRRHGHNSLITAYSRNDKLPLSNGYIAQQLIGAGYENLVSGVKDAKDKNLVERTDTMTASRSSRWRAYR